MLTKTSKRLLKTINRRKIGKNPGLYIVWFRSYCSTEVSRLSGIAQYHVWEERLFEDEHKIDLFEIAYYLLMIILGDTFFIEALATIPAKQKSIPTPSKIWYDRIFLLSRLSHLKIRIQKKHNCFHVFFSKVKINCHTLHRSWLLHSEVEPLHKVSSVDHYSSEVDLENPGTYRKTCSAITFASKWAFLISDTTSLVKYFRTTWKSRVQWQRLQKSGSTSSTCATAMAAGILVLFVTTIAE